MPATCSRCQRPLGDSPEPPLFCPHCGQRVRKAEAAAPAVVEEVERAVPSNESSAAPAGYRIVRHLGSGGMGDVYEAAHDTTGERVALKFLAKQFATNPEAVEQFRSIGDLTKAIAHPRCVRVFSVGDNAGRPFVAMELMPGHTLKDLADREGRLPPERAIHYVLDAIDGVSAAHGLGIVHCDIKPSNCLLTDDDRVKIGDFGLCRVYGTDQPTRTPSRRRAFSGTLLFAAPEQIRGEAVGFDSDIYSVCATLYYLLSGRAPHQAESLTAALAKAISEPAPPLRPIAPGVSAKLERAVLKGLDRERNRRWSSLEELRAALQVERLPKRWFNRLLPPWE